MNNVFKLNQKLHSQFSFGRMGNLAAGRPTLGGECPVLVYRLMVQTMQTALVGKLGSGPAALAFFRAGALAGRELAVYRLALEAPPADFFAQLSVVFRELKMGNLTVDYSEATGTAIFTVENDLGCSGMQNAAHTACQYDAGLFAGVLESYTGKPCTAELAQCEGGRSRFCAMPLPEESP